MPSRPKRPRRSRATAKEETRAALLAAALEAFAEQGFDAPSLDAICARAGLTRGAFYVHFPDREALVVATVGRVVATFLDAILRTDGASDDLATSVGRFADAVRLATTGSRGERREPMVVAGLLPLYRLLEAASRSTGIRARLVDIVREARTRVAVAVAGGQRAGRVRSDVAADDLATVLVATAFGVLVGTEVGVPLDVAGLQAAVLAVVAPIVTPPAPRRRGAGRA
jgi:TetR/AcrR family transcriptional repressor of nem operon